MSLSLICLLMCDSDVLHGLSLGLHSEARAGVGLGLTEIRAPTSGMEPRAGVREGLASIHAPINSQLSTELSTVEFDEQAPEESEQLCLSLIITSLLELPIVYFSHSFTQFLTHPFSECLRISP